MSELLKQIKKLKEYKDVMHEDDRYLQILVDTALELAINETEVVESERRDSEKGLEDVLKSMADRNGLINASELNLDGYAVDFSGIRAKTIFNRYQKADGIYNDNQQAEEIFNTSQEADGIYNNHQKAEEIDNYNQKARAIYNDDQQASVTYNDNQVINEKKD